MPYFIQQIVDWSEVWAPLIPLWFYRRSGTKVNWAKPLYYYCLFAFINNFISTFFWKQIRLGIYDTLKDTLPFLYNQDGTYSNVLLYNTGSLFRFILLSWFFALLLNRLKSFFITTAALYFLFFVYLFFITGDVRDFSSPFLGTEAALLLTYCLIFYFYMIRNEHSSIKNTPPFWAVTGLSVYVVINFPIFLFYNVLSAQSENFAINIWDIHNLSYIVFCILIARSFYVRKH